MKVEAIHFSGMSVDFYQAITHYHIPVDNILLWGDVDWIGLA
jgi:hypothetical protein